MSDSNSQLHWSEEQWSRVRQVVYEEARKARVAGSFLPLYGPLGPDATTVKRQTPSIGSSAIVNSYLEVDDTKTWELTTLQEFVYLTGAQVADSELESATLAFRRAANLIARKEDELVFNAQHRPSGSCRGLQTKRQVRYNSQGWAVVDPTRDPLVVQVRPAAQLGTPTPGDRLVEAVSDAIEALETKNHLGPFACVFGNKYFTDVQTPDGSSVLPSERIVSLLGGGALMRTSALKSNDSGLVIALAGDPIDLVVGTDISVKFLQTTLDGPRYVFRVHEKVCLRVKYWNAIALLER